MITTGTFQTANASRYLQQLCKHFGHKVEVAFDENSGRAELPVGLAEMRASEEQLEITISVASPTDLERAHGIIDSHLERFAFREGFTKMDWSKTE